MLQSRVSQSQHCLCFGLDNSLLWGLSGGADDATPNYAALACGLLSAEGNYNPAESGKDFYLPLYCLKEFR